jgi:hypothetical protein
VCKAFYVALFSILFFRIIVLLFIAVYSAIVIIYPSSDISAYKTHVSRLIQCYLLAWYAMEGLLMALIIFLFWVLRTAYTLGQVSSVDAILQLNRGSPLGSRARAQGGRAATLLSAQHGALGSRRAVVLRGLCRLLR